MVTNIINGRIIAGDSIVEGVLVLKDGVIQGINKRKSPGAEVIDAEGRYVSPGFIDIHTHGAGGADFMDGTVEAYQTATRMHAVHGTTLLFPTTLTSSNEVLFDSFETYRKALSCCRDGAAMGGLHLEGPYFAPEQAGAQAGYVLFRDSRIMPGRQIFPAESRSFPGPGQQNHAWSSTLMTSSVNFSGWSSIIIWVQFSKTTARKGDLTCSSYQPASSGENREPGTA